MHEFLPQARQGLLDATRWYLVDGGEPVAEEFEWAVQPALRLRDAGVGLVQLLVRPTLRQPTDDQFNRNARALDAGRGVDGVILGQRRADEPSEVCAEASARIIDAHYTLQHADGSKPCPQPCKPSPNKPCN